MNKLNIRNIHFIDFAYIFTSAWFCNSVVLAQATNTSSSTLPRRFPLLPLFVVTLLRSSTSTKSATNIVSRRCNVDQATPSKAQLHPALSSMEKANWCLCSQSHVEDTYSILGPPDLGIPATRSETQLNLFYLSTWPPQ